MKINEKKLAELGACVEGIDMFRRYPGLDGGCAEVGALCRWAASEGEIGYVRWLLPRLMEPELAVKWAILTAKRHCADADWNKWADKWLSGEDRTEKSAEATRAAARAATRAATRAAAWTAATWAAWVARTAAWIARTATWEAWEADWAAWVAEYAYDAAEDKTAEIELQIRDAMEILSVDGKRGKKKG